MVKCHDVAVELRTEPPTQQGHQALEESEGSGDSQGGPHIQATHAQALAESDGEGVGGDADGDEQERPEGHQVSLPDRQRYGTGRRLGVSRARPTVAIAVRGGMTSAPLVEQERRVLGREGYPPAPPPRREWRVALRQLPLGQVMRTGASDLFQSRTR